VQQVKETSLLLSTLPPLLNAKHYSSAETISTPFQLQLLTNMHLMVSFPESSQWESPVQELTEMTLLLVTKSPEELVNTF
jgi:hypothetical protein